MDILIYLLDKFGILQPAVAFIIAVLVIAVVERVIKRS
jgi:hypothetical protein